MIKLILNSLNTILYTDDTISFTFILSTEVIPFNALEYYCTDTKS